MWVSTILTSATKPHCVIFLSYEYSHLQQMHYCVISLLCECSHLQQMHYCVISLLCEYSHLQQMHYIVTMWILTILTSATKPHCVISLSGGHSHICNKLYHIFIMWAFSHLQQTLCCVICLSCGHSHICNKHCCVICLSMWVFSRLQQTLLCNMFIYVGILTSATHCCAVSLPCGTHNCNKHTVIRRHHV